MKKYRNASKYRVIEQGRVFLSGQALELPYEPKSPYLVEEAAKPEKVEKAERRPNNRFSSMSAEDLRSEIEARGLEYTNKANAIDTLLELETTED